MNNIFTEKYTHLTDAELLAIIQRPENYQPSAVEAARQELKNRNFSASTLGGTHKAQETKHHANFFQQPTLKEIEDTMKSVGQSFVDTINPLEKKVSSTDRFIRIICFILGAIFIYNIIVAFDLYTSLIEYEDIPELLYYFPIFLTPFAVYFFYRKKRTGWLLLSFLLAYTCCSILVSFIVEFADTHEFGIFFATSPDISYVISFIFYTAIFIRICKADMRSIFQISRKNALVVVAIAIAILAVQWLIA